MQDGNLTQQDWDGFYKVSDMLGKSGLTIIDSCCTLAQIRQRAKVEHKRGKCDMVYIDYLQLIGDRQKGENREQEISGISRAFKLMAKEFNIPVVLLSQLNRAVETRGGTKKPVLSDLRESGAIEQNADIVQFLYRPEYYDIEIDGMDNKGLAYLIVAKFRNGPLIDIPLKFIPWLTKFEDIAPSNFTKITPF